MRRRVYSNEFMIHLAIDAAKQCGSFEKIRIRKIAQMGHCSTQPFYKNFSNIEQLRMHALQTFVEEATTKTGFRGKVNKSSFKNWREFCDLFFDCFHRFKDKELLLENPECRIQFYRHFISPFVDDLLGPSDKKLFKLYYSFLVQQVLLDERVEYFF